MLDDFGQHSAGTLNEVALNISIAAAQFVMVAHRLRLTLSTEKPATSSLLVILTGIVHFSPNRSVDKSFFPKPSAAHMLCASL